MDNIWYDHILEEHSEMSGHYENMLDTIENPTFISRGHKGAKIAIKNFGRRKWLHVFYRELNQDDGFVFSASLRTEYDENLIIWSEIEHD